MRLLLDEMYAGLKEYFEILEWDVLTVHDAKLKGAKDKEIVEYAKNNNLAILTRDWKTADLADLIGVKKSFKACNPHMAWRYIVSRLSYIRVFQTSSNLHKSF